VEKINPQEQNYKESRTALQKAGSFIKEARNARSISIEQLSESLRIGKEQLLALENGQEDLLPERVFVKAMIRRISEKLNIDTAFILEELKGREISIKKLYEPIAQKEEETNSTILGPLMIIASGILGITASFFLINHIKNSVPALNSGNHLSGTYLSTNKISTNLKIRSNV
tara:strand:- start:336 stop:851 length:516 start_codon:yes stop_codon:yes gene_type:complete